jgi:hypothetical protein
MNPTRNIHGLLCRIPLTAWQRVVDVRRIISDPS